MIPFPDHRLYYHQPNRRTAKAETPTVQNTFEKAVTLENPKIPEGFFADFPMVQIYPLFAFLPPKV